LPEPTDFAETLHAVADVEGWMTDAQARRLWNRASAVPERGQIVEIGSFHGRSTVVLARAAPAGAAVVAIDPHAGSDRGPHEIEASSVRGISDHDAFTANLTRLGVKDRVRHVRRASQEAGPDVEGPIDLLYIDGAHRLSTARADIRDWGRRVTDGGSMLIHDSFCSVGVTGAIVTELIASRRFRYVGRTGSLAEYRVATDARLRSALRQIGQLPWFVRSVAVKVLLVLHLRPLTRLLGHPPDQKWPF
jgi:predicted O-methyltransferase YrrM